MQHMQQNDQKMLPKSTQKLPKSTPRRPRCSQDGLLEPTWAPKRLPRRPKNTQKGCVFLLFSSFWCQMLPSAPQDAQDSEIWSKKSPQDLPRPPLDLDFITIFDDFDDILKEFSSCFAFLCFPLLCFAFRYFTGSTTNHPHYQNNASTRQPHFRNNMSLPTRWRVIRST